MVLDRSVMLNSAMMLLGDMMLDRIAVLRGIMVCLGNMRMVLMVMSRMMDNWCFMESDSFVIYRNVVVSMSLMMMGFSVRLRNMMCRMMHNRCLMTISMMINVRLMVLMRVSQHNFMFVAMMSIMMTMMGTHGLVMNWNVMLFVSDLVRIFVHLSGHKLLEKNLRDLHIFSAMVISSDRFGRVDRRLRHLWYSMNGRWLGDTDVVHFRLMVTRHFDVLRLLHVVWLLDHVADVWLLHEWSTAELERLFHERRIATLNEVSILTCSVGVIGGYLGCHDGSTSKRDSTHGLYCL